MVVDSLTLYRSKESEPAYHQLEDTYNSETVSESWNLKQSITDLHVGAKKVRKTMTEQIFKEKVRNIMFGGLDGVITTFAIVCAGIGMNLSDKEIFVVALASLFADAVSMGYGDFASSKMERNYYRQEYKLSQRIYRTNREIQIGHLTEHLSSQGISSEDAKLISSTMSRYEEVFVGEITRLRLDMSDPGSFVDILGGALATFISFIVVGCVPVVIFLIADLNEHSKAKKVPILSGMCMVMLFCLGAICAYYTKQRMILRGFETMLYGTTAAAVAYGIAHCANS